MKLKLLILPLSFFLPIFGMQLTPLTIAVWPPKDILLLETIPHLSANEGLNLAMTCKDLYSKLCRTHEDKIRLLLSCSIPMGLNAHRRALIFYAQQFNSTNDITTKKNCEEYIKTLVAHEGDRNKQIRIDLSTLFNKSCSITDTIEFYGRNYLNNQYNSFDIDNELLTNHDLYVLKLLSAQKFNANTQDTNGQTLLHHIISNNNLECLQYLIDHFEIDPNIQSNDGSTPLHCAPSHCDIQKGLEFLITDMAFNPNIQDNDGNTSLHLFVANGNIKGIDFLLNNVTSNCFTHMSLFIESLKALSRQQLTIDPNIKNKDGDTPLHIACKYHNIKAIKHLLQDYAVDPNIKDKNGDTPVHWAIQVNNKKCLQLLLSNTNTDPNIKDNDNNTPLHSALLKKRTTCIQYLLNNSKINPNIRDKDGDSPFSCIQLYKDISEKEEIKYMKLFLSNHKTKLSLMEKALVYVLRKTNSL